MRGGFRGEPRAREGVIGRPARRCRAPIVLALLLAVTAQPAVAQRSGDGYLFGAPHGRLSVRGGFSHATAAGDLFDEVTTNLTLSRRDFSGAYAGAEFGVNLTDRLEFGADIAYMATRTPSEYRAFVDNSNRPIAQTTELRRIPVMLNARFHLTPPGRSIGRLAWIPASVAPWVGAGVGAMWYRFDQRGDFIDFNTNKVFADEYLSTGWQPAVQVMAGLDMTITPRLAITGDARYIHARAPLSKDFVGFRDRIDLSGAAVALGLTVRL